MAWSAAGRNFFFDWRALALGVAFYLIYRFWIRTRPMLAPPSSVFGVVAAIRIATLFFSYLRGQGDSLLGLRIPLFDGPSISAFVFAAILGLRRCSQAIPQPDDAGCG